MKKLAQQPQMTGGPKSREFGATSAFFGVCKKNEPKNFKKITLRDRKGSPDQTTLITNAIIPGVLKATPLYLFKWRYITG
jgi:hypothetical protein